MGAASYARVIPARFSGDSDDIFMRSVLSNYAIEGALKDHPYRKLLHDRGHPQSSLLRSSLHP